MGIVAAQRGIKEGRQRTFSVLAACLLAAIALLLVLAPRAYAAETVFRVTYTNGFAQESIGTIEYKVVQEPSGSELGHVLLIDGTDYHAPSVSTVLLLGTVTDSSTGLRYKVAGVNRDAFKNNTSLYAVEFQNDLNELSQAKNNNDLDTLCAVGPYAFSGCTNLKRVAFKGTVIDGIGAYAFNGCTALEEVSFAAGTVIRTTGIQQRAFHNCASLTALRIPAITAATRRGDSYGIYGVEGSRFKSGYAPYWHNNNYCVATEGIGAEAFSGCSQLESIVFEAGNDVGMFAYWKNAGCGLRYLPKLETVVYEAAQPYFGNPNGSLANQAFVSVWGEDVDYAGTPADPTFYYAVDYYATKDAAEADDAFGKARLARMEYKQGTPIGAIQSSSSNLQSYCAEASLYATGSGDGTAPDPNQAARAEQAKGTAGFEQANAHSWVWMLDNGQSRLSGLADSCKAYLVRADDISAGRIESTTGEKQLEAMYRAGVQNLSKGSVQNTTFDPERYLNDPSDLTSYRYSEKSLVNLEAGTTPWFTLDGSGLAGLITQLQLYDGAGNLLDLQNSDAFTVTYKKYVVSSKSYEEVDLSGADISEGPLLMVIQPKESSGYSTSSSLMEWVLVKASEGSVVSLFEETAARTWYAALYSSAYTALPQESFNTTKGYAVCVSSGDPLAALVATSYAGLAKGSLNVTSDAEGYGFAFALPGGYYENGVVYTENLKSFTRGTRGASSYANACYEVFNENRSTYGATDFTWGKTALLIHPDYLEEVAAAAASFAYDQAAPIFFTESNGSLSAETLEILKGFESVVVLADSSMVSDKVLKGVGAGLGPDTSVVRVAGESVDAEGKVVEVPGNAMAFSLAMAKHLITVNKSSAAYKNVAVVFAESGDVVLDAVGAQNFAGHRGGLTLVASSSADAKAVSQYLRDHKFALSNVRLFGRNSAVGSTSSFNAQKTMEGTWTDSDAVPAVAKGDSLELYGASLSLGAESKATFVSRLWGTQAIEEGTYTGRGLSEAAFSYTFAGVEKESDKKTVKPPAAKTNLTYNGGALTGVSAGTGYTVKGGTATKAGTYTATVTLKSGYAWADGSTAAKTISWSIAKASLKNASVKLSSKKMTYTGKSVGPTVKSVTLANGVKLSKSDYTVTYKNNVKPGTATVYITGKGSCSGSVYASFEIVKKSSGGSSSGKTDSSSSNSSSSGNSSNSSGSSSSSSGAAAGASTASDDSDDSDGSEDDSGSDSDAAAAGDEADDADSSAEDENALPGGARMEDGWLVFDAPGQAAGEESAAAQEDGWSIIPLLLMVLCLGSMAAAIVYSTRYNKETDDLIEGGVPAHA